MKRVVNRLTKSVVTNGATPELWSFSFGDATNGFNSNQLISYNRPETGETVSFTYDLNGNRAGKTVASADGFSIKSDTHSYDYNNRLVSLDYHTDTNSDKNGLYKYQYDHRTRRVSRDESTANSTNTRVVFSGGLSVQEHDEVTGAWNLATPSVEYIRGSDYGGGVGGVLYTIRNGSPSFNYYNSRGDVLAKTDDSGTTTWQANYEAFGTRTAENGETDDRQKANTKDEDPTGLLNEHYRYRDLEAGVFITRDPLGFVDGPNVYTYVRQNPWSSFDPLGLETYPIIYYDNEEKDSDKSFPRAAETKKKEIEGRKDFDAKKDRVIMKPVKTARDFKEAWTEIDKETNTKNSNDQIKEMNIYSHGGKGDDRIDDELVNNDPQLNFAESKPGAADGGLRKADFDAMEKLNFSKDGSIHCKACLSGLTGSDGSDSVVKNLNDRQGVTTYGERGYATFSERGGRKKLYDRATPSSPKLYLNSHGDGTGGWAAYGRGRQKTKVENGKSTKATIPLVNW